MKMESTNKGYLIGLGAFIAILISLSTPADAVTPPPTTRVDSQVDTLFGVPVADPYRWLEDQDSPETRAWIDSQNAYTHSLLDTIWGRDALRKRFKELFLMDQTWVRAFVGDRFILSKRKAADALSSIYMRDGLKGDDQLLIDPMTLSKDSSVSAGIVNLSLDGKLMVYSLRKGGQDETTIRIMNLDTRTNLPDTLPKARYFGGVVLTADNSGLYYSTSTDNGPRVYYHKVGTDVVRDSLIMGEQYGAEWIVSVSTSDDRQYLILTAFMGSSGTETEIYLKDLSANGPLVTAVKGVKARFEPQIAGGRMYVLTDWDAPNNRIMVADPTNPVSENWKELVPASDLSLQDLIPAGGVLLLKYLDSVKTRIKVVQPDGKDLPDLKLATVGMTGTIIGDWKSDKLFVTFGSFTYPWTQFLYDMKSWQSTVFERVNIPLDPDKFLVKQVWYDSKDGTRVPMFVVHAKDLKLDGNRPVYMTGYGGFNAAQQPYFSQWAIVWMEHGGVYVSTNLRGGSEFGEAWHKAAMFEKKQNTFDDFIAAGEWLITNGYTNSSRLAIEGGSNGGLLVGAALTQRPDLFGAVICSYPLLDMVRFHRFLVAKFWVSEYGSADDSTQFPYIYQYSPYHNVRKGIKYPAVLFITGDADTRVAPLHARKMTALLQGSTGSDKPILLEYDTKAGHSGGKTYDKMIDELVDEFSFLFWQLGMNSK